jgi:hypothetical protein
MPGVTVIQLTSDTWAFALNVALFLLEVSPWERVASSRPRYGSYKTVGEESGGRLVSPSE